MTHRFPLEPEATLTHLSLELPWNARLKHARDWHVFHVRSQVAVLRLLETFRAAPVHLAFIVDEYGDWRRIVDKDEAGGWVYHAMLTGPDARLGDLAEIYGVDVAAGDAAKSLSEYLNERFHGRVVVGDSAPLGNAMLVARELRDGRVSRVGLKLR